MELREWQYINKPAANSNTASAASTSSTSFKKRFDKIIKYYGDHLPAEVDYVLVNLLTNGSLNFTENYDNGDKVQYDIFIDDFDTEDWGIKIKVNGQPTEKYFDKGWAKLLNTLGAYIELPQMGDPEYKNLLTEWVVMNNKTSSSSGYKKRFEKLIKYHIDHASSELESVTRKDIFNYSFRFSEHYNTGSQEFDRDIIVSIDRTTDTFYLSVFIDHKQTENNNRIGWENFLKLLDNFMWLPSKGTPDYDDLLTESLREWKYANPPKASQPASSTTGGYWKRFNKLIYYHVRHKGRDVDKVIRTKVSKDGFHYTEHHRGGVSGYEYDVVVNIDLATDHWTFQTSVDGKPRLGGAGDGYLELLKELRKHLNLPAEGTPDYDSLLTESLNEWKLMNPPASSSAPSTGSFESYKNRFKKLFNYATKHRHSSVDQTAIEELSEDEHTSMFHFTHHVLGGAQGFDYDLEIILAINKPQGNWYLLVYEFDGKTHDKIADLQGPDYETLLKTLSDYIEVPAVGSAEYKDLLQESINTSIADDFKLYENLWENI